MPVRDHVPPSLHLARERPRQDRCRYTDPIRPAPPTNPGSVNRAGLGQTPEGTLLKDISLYMSPVTCPEAASCILDFLQRCCLEHRQNAAAIIRRSDHLLRGESGTSWANACSPVIGCLTSSAAKSPSPVSAPSNSLWYWRRGTSMAPNVRR